jgi:hypothetical protein
MDRLQSAPVSQRSYSPSGICTIPVVEAIPMPSECGPQRYGGRAAYSVNQWTSILLWQQDLYVHSQAGEMIMLDAHG